MTDSSTGALQRPANTDHINGPWRTEGWENLVVNDAAGDTVIVCPGGSKMATLEQIKARSALIGAAPEMLEALRTIVERLEDLGGYGETWMADARAAIAKAEGRS